MWRRMGTAAISMALAAAGAPVRSIAPSTACLHPVTLPAATTAAPAVARRWMLLDAAIVRGAARRAAEPVSTATAAASPSRPRATRRSVSPRAAPTPQTRRSPKKGRAAAAAETTSPDSAAAPEGREAPQTAPAAAATETEVEPHAWWEEGLTAEGDGSVQWQTLHHRGVWFPPSYEPHGVPLLYDGVEVPLTPAQEEVASFYASMLDTDYVRHPTFNRNFFADFRRLLGRGHVVKQLDRCDFSRIAQHLQQRKEQRKQLSPEERKVSASG